MNLEKIKIFVIDSGVNINQSKLTKKQIKSYEYRNNKILPSLTVDNDEIGHGTAIIDLLSELDNIELVSIKVSFRKDSHLSIVKALEFALDNKADIINFSIGIKRDNHGEIENVCNIARKNNIFVVTAVSNDYDESYPASYPTTFRIAASNNNFYTSKFIRTKDIYGDVYVIKSKLKNIPWISGRNVFSSGNSFHTYDFIKIIVEYFNFYKKDEIAKLIYDSIPYVENEFIKKINEEIKLDWIKNALLFPINKEILTIIRHHEMLNFDIYGIADIKFSDKLNKKISLFEKTTLEIVVNNFENLIEKVDTVIIGHLEEISNIHGEDLLFKYVNIAVEKEKNIVSLSSLEDKKFEKLILKAQKNNTKIYYPSITRKRIDDKKRLIPSVSGKIVSQPVIGVYGTSSKLGKFGIQIELRNHFLNSGYKVGQLGTEPISKLFDFDEVFPNGYMSENELMISEYVRYLDFLMKKISLKKPDIIITGSQSGIIPKSLTLAPTNSYTLPTIGFLMGTRPDFIILAINYSDEISYIKRSVDTINIISKARVIGLVMNRYTKIINSLTNSINTIKLEEDKYSEKIVEIEKKLNYEVYDVYDKKSCDKLFNNIQLLLYRGG